jgi:hypothetical protein
LKNGPTIPILRLLPGRPRSVFFSGPAAFFGGILVFFAKRETDVEKWYAETGGRRRRTELPRMCLLESEKRLVTDNIRTEVTVTHREISATRP